MTAIVPEEAQVQMERGGVELRTHEIGGDMTVAFIRAPAGWDLIDHVKSELGLSSP